MSAPRTEPDAGRRWPAIVVVALLAVLMGVLTVWAVRTPDATRTAGAHEAVTLTGGADELRVSPIPGWDVTGQSESELHLTHHGDTVTVTALQPAVPTPTLSTMFQRQARLLTLQDIAATQQTTQQTKHGYRGVDGTAVGNGKLGRLSVLRQGDQAVSVLVLAAPARLTGYQPQLRNLYDSITEVAS